MKTLLIAIGLVAAFALAPQAQAASQKNRAACKAEAGDKKGDERKAFMKTCLSEKAAASKGARTAQQEKMKACNADAKKDALKGDKRREFMKTCLSNK
jgi:psiF repeat